MYSAYFLCMWVDPKKYITYMTWNIFTFQPHSWVLIYIDSDIIETMKKIYHRTEESSDLIILEKISGLKKWTHSGSIDEYNVYSGAMEVKLNWSRR